MAVMDSGEAEDRDHSSHSRCHVYVAVHRLWSKDPPESPTIPQSFFCVTKFSRANTEREKQRWGTRERKKEERDGGAVTSSTKKITLTSP